MVALPLLEVVKDQTPWSRSESKAFDKALFLTFGNKY